VTEFDAVYYDGRTSARKPVRVRGYTGILQIVGEGLRLDVPLAKVQVDPPVGGTRRALHLPGGAQLQTDDDAAVESLFPRPRALESWVDALERSWPHAIAAIALIAAFAWWSVVDGLPRAAKIVAGFVPPAVETRLGEQTLAFFERSQCGPSELGIARQETLQRRFAALTEGLADGYAYRLLPRACRGIGANAFALPGGPVVITDALVRLAQSDDQIAAVLAHEIGHVHYRHGLRLGLQAAGLAALTVALLGDATSITSLATTLPAALLQSGYSRELETEADDYAFERMKEIGLPPRAFAEMMRLLEKDRQAKSGGAASGYLSTHPATAKRIERALAADRAR
jgi:Zn-dependent protease with chaperone function